MTVVPDAMAMLTNRHSDLCLPYRRLSLSVSVEFPIRRKHIAANECVMTLAPIEESIDDKHSTEAVHSIPLSELTELTAIGINASTAHEPLNDIPSTEIINPRWVNLSAALAAASLLLLHICEMNFCDPDMWHEMSLFRQTLIEGSVPTEDRFAYTPTVSPSIHHEWGAGAIFYAVLTTFRFCRNHGAEILARLLRRRRLLLVRENARRKRRHVSVHGLRRCRSSVPMDSPQFEPRCSRWPCSRSCFARWNWIVEGVGGGSQPGYLCTSCG